jgi:hypothetical protein
VGVLKSTKLGYLSLSSKKGELYSFPMAFHYSDHKIFFITPIGSAKMKLIRANPNLSFIVDNGKLPSNADMTAACGAMFQGNAKVFSFARMMGSFFSMGAMGQFPKKYPGMLSTYLDGKHLPPERKFHKYRLVRINPSKIVYWTGYKFGRYVPSKMEKENASLAELKDPAKIEGITGLVETADEELVMDEIPPSEDWLGELKAAVSNGILSEEETRVMGMYRKPIGLENSVKPGELSSGEKTLLKKWKASKANG